MFWLIPAKIRIFIPGAILLILGLLFDSTWLIVFGIIGLGAPFAKTFLKKNPRYDYPNGYYEYTDNQWVWYNK